MHCFCREPELGFIIQTMDCFCRGPVYVFLSMLSGSQLSVTFLHLQRIWYYLLTCIDTCIHVHPHTCIHDLIKHNHVFKSETKFFLRHLPQEKKKKTIYTQTQRTQKNKNQPIHECLDQLCNSPVQERAHILLDSLYVFSVYTYQWKY